MSSVKKILQNPAKIVFLLDKLKINWLLPSKTYLKLKYKACIGKKLDLKNPQTFNEKLQWLKLNDKKPIYTTMVDKYEVKKYVAERIGEEYIIPTLGVWDNFDDIDFDTLPNQFVLKCTHDSGGLVIVQDKANFNRKQAKKKIEKALKTNYYLLGREWPYKNVKRRIIAEQYMEDAETQELRDYKFFCFNGVVKYFKIDYGRFINRRANYYDVNSKLLPFGVICPNDSTRQLEIPENLNQMLKLASILAEEKIFIRVDFYNVNKKVYFGELTFFPGSGFGKFEPQKWDSICGEYIRLPIK